MYTRREFLTCGPLLAYPKHTLEFTEVVRRSNLIQQILKHDPDSGRVYTAALYRDWETLLQVDVHVLVLM